MKAIEVGSVCVKTAGREAGEKAIVLEIVDGNFVIIEGEKIKKRKCNIRHIFPTGEVMKEGQRGKHVRKAPAHPKKEKAKKIKA